MKSLLIILAIFAAGLGLLLFVASHEAPLREVESILFFILAAILFTSAALLGALESIRSSLKSNPAPSRNTSPPIITGTNSADYLVQLPDGAQATFTLSQLRALRSRGSIDAETQVLPPGSTSWVRLADLSDRLHA
jgi:hypothetical protein